MTSEKALDNKGFTLIELIVVVVILGVLAVVLVPNYIGYIEKAKIGVDNASLEVLNENTALYKNIKAITTADVFAGISTDADRMQKLVAEGFLTEAALTKQKNASFAWDIPTQQWVINVSAPAGTIAVTGVSLPSTLIVSYPGNGGGNAGPKTLAAVVLPSNASNKAVTWISSNPENATVDSNGVVNFVKPGTSVITVTTVDGNKTATCTVTTQW